MFMDPRPSQQHSIHLLRANLNSFFDQIYLHKSAYFAILCSFYNPIGDSINIKTLKPIKMLGFKAIPSL